MSDEDKKEKERSPLADAYANDYGGGPLVILEQEESSEKTSDKK